MALSSSVSNMILVMFVSCLAFDMLIGSTKSFVAKADLIDDICSGTTPDPEFCKIAFRSDPRSSTADLPTLAKIAIDLAQSNTKSTITLVKSLERSAKDPKLKGIYDSCLENYKDTSSTLDDCTSDLKAKDYPTLSQHGAAALNGPDTCDENFSNPPEPHQLKQSSNHIQELCGVICVIAGRLSGKM